MSITEIGRIAFICLEVVLLFNLLIFVHELGHFLAGKWRGLYIEEFALWFGKPLWRKKIGGVWYAINSIPAGGYVKLPQMAPMGSIEGESGDLPEAARRPISPLDKIIVAFAGPLFSLLLAFTMAAIVWQVGKPESEFDSTTVGFVGPGGPADQAGLKVGDVIREVDGKKVTHFVSGTTSIKWAIIRSEGEKIPFLVERNGQLLTIESKWIKPETANWRRPPLREVQIGPRLIPGVGFVVHGSPADKAGFRANDLIVEANGKPIKEMADLEPYFENGKGENLNVVVEREGARVPLALPVPAATKDKPVDLGIEWGRVRLINPSPLAQVEEAATTIFRMVGALVSPHSDVGASHFSGPVGIMRLYYQVFESSDGWRRALVLSVLINVNLALINMLPFPVLDGGHITLALIEAIRRKPVNVRLLEIVQTACALVIIGFMLYVTFFDVGDMFGDRRSAARQQGPDKPAPEQTGNPSAAPGANAGGAAPSEPAK